MDERNKAVCEQKVGSRKEASFGKHIMHVDNRIHAIVFQSNPRCTFDLQFQNFKNVTCVALALKGLNIETYFLLPFSLRFQENLATSLISLAVTLKIKLAIFRFC